MDIYLCGGGVIAGLLALQRLVEMGKVKPGENVQLQSYGRMLSENSLNKLQLNPLDRIL